MRRLIVTIDDPLDDWLSKELNQAETVRKALRLYHGDITAPDSIESLRAVLQEHRDYMTSHFGTYDRSFEKLDRLIEEFETRL